MINPFQYGGIVGKDAFCNRKRELADLKRAMQNGERLFVYSERRLGKTSLVKLALGGLPSGRILSTYVDLWPTDGEASFATAVARALTESIAGTPDRMLQAAKQFFSGLIPAVSVDADGRPQLSFSVTRSGTGAGAPELRQVLEAPAAIAAKRKRRVVIVLDEFQRILEYGDDLVERTLRSTIQSQKDVSYVFLGSRKHLIQRMFLDRERPLYRAGGHYPLGTIATADWLPFIRSRFRKSQRDIDRDLIHLICEKTGGHPFYTQHLCHVIWELCEPGRPASASTVDSAVDLLLERESYAYTSLWETLGLNHRRLLVGLAQEPAGTKVFGSDFIRRYNLRSASSAQRAVDTLLERDIVDRDNGSIVIIDRFFRIWVQRTATGS